MTSFRASGDSTGRRAKSSRFCLRCEEPVFGAGKNCDICGKPAEKFDSKAEYNHFQKLRLRQRAREISDLKCHPKFDLVVMCTNDYNRLEQRHVCSYSPDFSYVVREPWRPTDIRVFDDVWPGKLVKSGKMKGQKKPVMTADAALKIKLFEALFGAKVNIVC